MSKSNEAKAAEGKANTQDPPEAGVPTEKATLDGVKIEGEDIRLPDNTVIKGRPADLPDGPLEVVAVETGYYDDRLRHPDGPSFVIKSKDDWGGWMRLVGPAKAE